MNLVMRKRTLSPPEAPTTKRYIDVFVRGSNVSITRALQYEELARRPVGAKLLDVGGGQTAGYRSLLRCEQYDSVNIDPSVRPTWIVEVGQAFPCNADFYDTVVSMNTFEHIFDVRHVVEQMHRALRPGGSLLAAVPFLYPIHGHPDDYFRPTPSWFFEMLQSAGFGEVEVKPLVWGHFSTGLVCSGIPGPFKRPRMHWALIKDLLYDRLRMATGRKDEPSSSVSRFSLSFFVHAIKC